MHSLSTILKIFLIIVAASHIVLAGPLFDLRGSDSAAEGADASGGSVSDVDRGDSLLSGIDLLELLSGNGGPGGKVVESVGHNKGGSSLTGTRHRQGNTVSQPASSAQGGSVSGRKGILNILSGNGGPGGIILGGHGFHRRND